MFPKLLKKFYKCSEKSTSDVSDNLTTVKEPHQEVNPKEQTEPKFANKIKLELRRLSDSLIGLTKRRRSSVASSKDTGMWILTFQT